VEKAIAKNRPSILSAIETLNILTDLVDLSRGPKDGEHESLSAIGRPPAPLVQRIASLRAVASAVPAERPSQFHRVNIAALTIAHTTTNTLMRSTSTTAAEAIQSAGQTAG